MYKHSTSRLIIGTSLYARENGIRDYPIEYTDIDKWLIQSGRALSELTDEYKSFASDVKKESKNTKARHLEKSATTGLLRSQISQKNDRQDEKTRPIVRDRQEILVDLLSRKRIPLPGGFL
jgi:hypothetical protein